MSIDYAELSRATSAVTRLIEERGEESADAVASMEWLGCQYATAENWAEAQRWLERAVSASGSSPLATPTMRARMLGNLGFVRLSQGDQEAARALYERRLSVQEAMQPPPLGALATSLDELAYVHALLGRFETATSLYERSLALRERQHGPTSPEVELALDNLGGLFLLQGKLDAAEEWFLRSHALQVARLGAEHAVVQRWYRAVLVAFSHARRTTMGADQSSVSPRLFPSALMGFGELHCGHCAHREQVTGLLHGEGFSSHAYQCQRCGAFGILLVDGETRTLRTSCDCPVGLPRELPVFCPSCRSVDVSFRSGGRT